MILLSSLSAPDSALLREKRTYYNYRGRNCGKPGAPGNGWTIFGGTTAGHKALHSCKAGYLLVGPKLRICQSNGRWTPNIPECRRELAKTSIESWAFVPIVCAPSPLTVFTDEEPHTIEACDHAYFLLLSCSDRLWRPRSTTEWHEMAGQHNAGILCQVQVFQGVQTEGIQL